MHDTDANHLRLDHGLFAALLIGLLLLPKMPLPIEELPEKSGAPIAILVLVVWVILRPRWLSLSSMRSSPGTTGLVLFASYAFLVSLASLSEISILYAAQYFLYVSVGVSLLSNYLTKAAATHELTTTIRIVAVIGLIYAAGVIASVFYGPLYEGQVVGAERRWNGLNIPQGIGFAEGPNSAAAVLLAVIPIVWLLFRPKRPLFFWLFAIAPLTALLVTISRSAILSFILAFGALGGLSAIRWFLQARMPMRAVRAMAVAAVVLATMGLVVEGLAQRTGFAEFGNAIAAGLGYGDTAIVRDDMELRGRFWEETLDTWSNSPPHEQLFGRGFRAIFQINDDQLAWASPHNAYLGILVDCGIVGLILFVVPLLGLVLTTGLEMCSSQPTPIKKTSYVIILALMGHNLSEVFFYSPVVIVFVLIVLILSSIERRSRLYITEAT